jgi:hypothetical protein
VSARRRSRRSTSSALALTLFLATRHNRADLHLPTASRRLHRGSTGTSCDPTLTSPPRFVSAPFALLSLPAHLIVHAASSIRQRLLRVPECAQHGAHRRRRRHERQGRQGVHEERPRLPRRHHRPCYRLQGSRL